MFKRSISILIGVILALGLTSATILAERVQCDIGTPPKGSTYSGYTRYKKGPITVTRWYRQHHGKEEDFYTMEYAQNTKTKKDGQDVLGMYRKVEDYPIPAGKNYVSQPRYMYEKLKKEYMSQDIPSDTDEMFSEAPKYKLLEIEEEGAAPRKLFQIIRDACLECAGCTPDKKE